MDVFQAQGQEFGFEKPGSLRYRNSRGQEFHFPYEKGLRLRVSTWTGELILQFRRRKAPLSGLPPEQRRSFLAELFRHWSRADAESARKAAFDYADAQRGFVPLAFAACLLVALPVSVALLADSHQQFRCTRELQAHSVPALMHAVKARKQDSRTFLLNFEFQAPNGQQIKGQEVVLTEKDVPPPMDYPMYYSPEHPECWSLTKTATSQEINWAKRRYFSWFGLLFGLFFLTVTFIGLAWCTLRWAQPRLYKEEVLSSAGISSL